MTSASASQATRRPHISRGHAFSFRVAALSLAACCALAGWADAAHAQQNDGFAEALAHAGNSVTSRTISLTGLGIRDVSTLGAPDGRREYYFPVPAGVPIGDAQLQLDADYLRGDGGRTTMLVSVDGSPVQARALTQPQGDAAATLGIGGAPRANGYVRVGLGWSSVINDAVCADQTAIGNVLRVAPTTHLSYRYDTADVKDLRTAWTALPRTPAVLIAGGQVSAASYDTAWRVAALLQRDGREPAVHSWPKVGDTLELGSPNVLDVPAPLRALPAFAALAAAGSHRLADPAELGALLVVGSARLAPADVIVMDDALRASLTASLDALQAQAAGVSASAADAFAAWRKRSAAALVAPLAAGEARLVHIMGQASIVVGDSQSIGVLSQVWRPVDVSNQMVVHEIDSAANGRSDAVSLAALGGEPGTIDVRREATWSAAFDLGAVAGAGRLPDDVVLDLAGSPNTHGSAVVASIYFNDVLIGARLLGTEGRAQHVVAHIPRYALAARNVLRVSLQRQSDAGCATNQGFPVAVLPSSHLTLVQADGDVNFTGMVARFASSATLIVPTAYLADATVTLPRVARLADAAGVAPQRAVLSVTPAGQSAAPTSAFLAVDVPLADSKSHVRVTDNGLTILGPDEHTLYDVSGVANLSGVGVIHVAHSGATAGVVYRSLGAPPPVLPAALQLGYGDVAVVDGSGVLKELDTTNAGGVERGSAGTPWSRDWLTWVVPAAVLGLFVALLLLAAHTRRRKRKQAGE
ncbi:cellulose synthase [Paraburkholderia xenovorans]|uniref:cellulose synthase n=1 Tax=Paraburkholderia xenovorans TaxID=36873 RepID=UPI0038B9BE69